MIFNPFFVDEQGRIVSMTLDVEHTVTVVAIKLVALLYRYVDAFVISNTRR